MHSTDLKFSESDNKIGDKACKYIKNTKYTTKSIISILHTTFKYYKKFIIYTGHFHCESLLTFKIPQQNKRI